MPKITEGTLVPLSLVGASLLTLLGGAMWLTSMYAQGNASAREIDILKAKHESLATEIHEIKLMLVRIENKLVKEDPKE
jgi:Tfp pilus assembly protein PilN